MKLTEKRLRVASRSADLRKSGYRIALGWLNQLSLRGHEVKSGRIFKTDRSRLQSEPEDDASDDKRDGAECDGDHGDIYWAHHEVRVMAEIPPCGDLRELTSGFSRQLGFDSNFSFWVLGIRSNSWKRGTSL